MKRLLFIVLFATLSFTHAMDRGCYRAHVVGLDPYGDNFLAVRTGPSTRYRQIDSLYSGDRLYVCDYNSKWRLVYYGSRCYLEYGRAVGRCDSGWVYGRYVR